MKNLALNRKFSKTALTANTQAILVLSVIAAAAVFPAMSPSRYIMTVITMGFIWSMATMGLNILLGLAGQASIAHGAFFGIGAYTFGILNAKHNVNFWLAMVIAVLFTSLLAGLISLPAIRTRITYFAIFTLCLNLIITSLVNNMEHITEGPRGLIGITRPAILASTAGMYYFCLILLVLVTLFVYRLRNSVIGLSWASIRINETLASSLGIKLVYNKIVAFMLSVAVTALAGALYAAAIGSLTPSITSFTISFYLLIYLIVGGPGTILGPIVGAFGLNTLTQLLYALEQYRPLIYGVIMIFCIVYMPLGVMGYIKARLQERYPALRKW
ncbi:MAG: branched-chain amino acid ABC transporter permease [Dethiobacter sp.]|jgi:branched-chain amino acid transport system permease protein|nr:branched-chain amino acid ABC transporter permease [Dethiobacter sp.]